MHVRGFNMGQSEKSRFLHRLLAAVMIISLIGSTVPGAAVRAASNQADAAGNTKKTITVYILKTKDETGWITLRRRLSSVSMVAGIVSGNMMVFSSQRKTGTDGRQWYRVRCNGKTGYLPDTELVLHSKDVTLDATAYRWGSVKGNSCVMRRDPSAEEARVKKLSRGNVVTITGSFQKYHGRQWLKVKRGKKTGYVPARSLRILSQKESVDYRFSAWLETQGFPDSYHTALWKLHKEHPGWVLKAQKTHLDWNTVLAAEQSGHQYVEPQANKNWKNTGKDYYNKKKKKFKVFDGRWNQASDDLIAYYLDPRNFLTEDSIFQFLCHETGAPSQHMTAAARLTAQSSAGFLNDSEGNHLRYLREAAEKTHINPAVLTSMILQEQSAKGSALVSGKVDGYRHLYNYLNIGAYHTEFMTAVERGLWWAGGEGKKNTSYGRPWNTRQKAITGGAAFYLRNYVKLGQNTYYTKKFNVMNGRKALATHEYMTNVEGAQSEGQLLCGAYGKNARDTLTFYIPVYENLPAERSPLPEKIKETDETKPHKKKTKKNKIKSHQQRSKSHQQRSKGNKKDRQQTKATENKKEQHRSHSKKSTRKNHQSRNRTDKQQINETEEKNSTEL